MRQLVWCSGFLLLLTSCLSAPDLPDFDSTAFKNDRRGCNGTREKLINTLASLRPKLMALKEPQIRAAFGKPEYEELDDHSERVYGYYLSPAPTCGTGPATTKAPRMLTLRVEARGRVKEMLLTGE